MAKYSVVELGSHANARIFVDSLPKRVVMSCISEILHILGVQPDGEARRGVGKWGFCPSEAQIP